VVVKENLSAGEQNLAIGLIAVKDLPETLVA
jgi:hypothetical protein